MKRLAPFSNFARNERGSALPLIGLGLFMLLGSAGIAIDMARVQTVQAKMSNALDAAGLAAGATISTTDINSVTNNYFYANFPSGYMGTTINTLTAVANGNNSIITLNVAGTVPTTFMKIFGLTSVSVSATSQITRANKGMELVLVMDNTGSMAQSAGGSVTKLQAAKSAGATLLNVLYGGANTVEHLWVGLVPFSQAVNVGTSHTAWLDATYDSTLKWGTTSWFGCVEARTNTAASPQYDVTDDPPSVKPFRQYNNPCNTNSSYNNEWYGTNSSKDNCNTGTGVAYKSGMNTSSLGPNLYCPQPVTPMVAEKSTIVTALNSMQAVGNTQINLGMAWAWRMLSPKWRYLWGGQMDLNDQPLDYDTPLMYKVVILMTDGDNTLSGSNSVGTATNKPGLYSAFTYPANNTLLVTGGECTSGSDCTKGQTELNNRTTSVCTKMKAEGILIYTIALGSSVSTTGKNLLKGCASKPEYYFLSPSTDDLETVFQQIGDSLANLRISQ